MIKMHFQVKKIRLQTNYENCLQLLLQFQYYHLQYVKLLQVTKKNINRHPPPLGIYPHTHKVFSLSLSPLTPAHPHTCTHMDFHSHPVEITKPRQRHSMDPGLRGWLGCAVRRKDMIWLCCDYMASLVSAMNYESKAKSYTEECVWDMHVHLCVELCVEYVR